MGQIGIAGVSAALPFVTGPSPAEVPTRRVQDQQSSRPVRETDEADDSGDQGAQVVLEEETSQSKRASAQQRVSEEEVEPTGSDREPQPGEQVDIRI